MTMRTEVRESPSQEDYMERVRAEGHIFLSRLPPPSYESVSSLEMSQNLLFCPG